MWIAEPVQREKKERECRIKNAFLLSTRFSLLATLSFRNSGRPAHVPVLPGAAQKDACQLSSSARRNRNVAAFPETVSSYFSQISCLSILILRFLKILAYCAQDCQRLFSRQGRPDGRWSALLPDHGPAGLSGRQQRGRRPSGRKNQCPGQALIYSGIENHYI